MNKGTFGKNKLITYGDNYSSCFARKFNITDHRNIFAGIDDKECLVADIENEGRGLTNNLLQRYFYICTLVLIHSVLH